MKLKIKIKIKGLILMACSYCKIIYLVKSSNGGESGLSHGCCNKCFDEQRAGEAMGNYKIKILQVNKQKCGVQPAF